ncbi:MAG TPA: hypothetical protein VMX79_08905 [bacterium]|nr:hypothetical protein [bacterium]
MAKAVTIAVSILCVAATARAGEPGGTPDALFFSEAAVGSAVGIALFVAGYAVGGDPAENDGNGREKASYGVYAAAPLAASLGVYVVGETSGHRSANRGVLLLATAGTFYGIVGGAGGIAYALTKEDKDAGALTAAFYAVIPAGFAAAAVYNALKKPYFYEIPGFSLQLEPSFGVCRAGPRGEELTPTWGITVSF